MSEEMSRAAKMGKRRRRERRWSSHEKDEGFKVDAKRKEEMETERKK